MASAVSSVATHRSTAFGLEDVLYLINDNLHTGCFVSSLLSYWQVMSNKWTQNISTANPHLPGMLQAPKAAHCNWHMCLQGLTSAPAGLAGTTMQRSWSGAGRGRPRSARNQAETRPPRPRRPAARSVHAPTCCAIHTHSRVCVSVYPHAARLSTRRGAWLLHSRSGAAGVHEFVRCM